MIIIISFLELLARSQMGLLHHHVHGAAVQVVHKLSMCVNVMEEKLSWQRRLYSEILHKNSQVDSLE